VSEQYHLQDQDIVDLLADMNNAGQIDYPAGLQEKRRTAFMAQVAGLAAVNSALSASITTPKPASAVFKPTLLRPFPGLLENILVYTAVAAAVTEMAVGVYMYRDKIRSLFIPDSPTAIVTTSPQIVPLSHPVGFTPRPTSSPAPSKFPPTIIIEQVIGGPTSAIKVNGTQYPTVQSNSNTSIKPTPLPGQRLGNTKTPKPETANKTPGPKNPSNPPKKP